MGLVAGPTRLDDISHACGGDRRAGVIPTATIPPVCSKPTQRRLLAHGDIIFYTYPGAAVPRHVVIYLGGDRILEAPQTGENVRYGTLSEFTGQTPVPPDHRGRDRELADGWRALATAVFGG